MVVTGHDLRASYYSYIGSTLNIVFHDGSSVYALVTEITFSEICTNMGNFSFNDISHIDL